MLRSIFVRDLEKEMNEVIKKEGITEENKKVLNNFSSLISLKNDMLFLDELRCRLRRNENEGRDVKNLIRVLREEVEYIFDKHKDNEYVELDYEYQQKEEDYEMSFKEYKNYIVYSLISDEEFLFDERF